MKIMPEGTAGAGDKIHPAIERDSRGHADDGEKRPQTQEKVRAEAEVGIEEKIALAEDVEEGVVARQAQQAVRCHTLPRKEKNKIAQYFCIGHFRAARNEC